MKRIFKNMTTLAIAMALMLSCIMIPSVDAAAKTTDKSSAPTIYMDDCTVYFVPANKKITVAQLINVADDAVIAVKSSNEEVAKVYYDKASKTVIAKILKPGKVTIACAVKENGVIYKETCKLKALKYKNPLKSLKIGDTQYKGLFKKNIKAGAKIGKKKQIVNVAVKDGFQLNGIYTINNGNYKEIKNGAKIDPKKSSGLYILIKDKNGRNLPITLNFK